MPEPRSVAAKTPAELPAVLDAVKEFRFPLKAASMDKGSRTVVLPFEKKHPRPESWELVVRGVRSVAVKGRLEQATDYFRGLRHDAAASVVEIEGVLVKVRITVDGLDVEARCLTPEPANAFDVADLPHAVRKEIEVRETASLKGRERYERRDRERVTVVTVVGGLAALVLGAGSSMPPLVLPFEAGAGACAAWWIAARRIRFFAATAGVFGGPTITLSLLSILITRGLSDGPVAGLAHGLFWSMMAGAGALLGVLNGKMMDDVGGLTTESHPDTAPPKPLDLRIPMRAAAIVGLGGAFLHLLFHAPWTVWAVASPFGCGGTAWLLARFQVPVGPAGRFLGAAGAVTSCMAIGGGAFVPAAVLLAAAHGGAGMMVAYYSRGEGPR